MPEEYTIINARGMIFGSANKDYPNNGSIPASKITNTMTITRCGVNVVYREIDICGYTRVFGTLDCATDVITGNIKCKGKLHTYRISPSFEIVIRDYVQDNLLKNKVQPI